MKNRRLSHAAPKTSIQAARFVGSHRNQGGCVSHLPYSYWFVGLHCRHRLVRFVGSGDVSDIVDGGGWVYRRLHASGVGGEPRQDQLIQQKVKTFDGKAV